MRRLWLVRHGESAGNVARDLAERDELLEIDVSARDVDVELSARGHQQAQAVGRWLRRQRKRPSLIFSSPHMRAQQTAEPLGTFTVDERLREKELGFLNRVTWRGVQENFPEQAAMRTALGKFYFRPPSGENWCDVILRVRSFLQTVPKHDVLLVTHAAVICCFRYVLEGLSEKSVLAIDATDPIANCAITIYDDGKLRAYNFTEPLENADASIRNEKSHAGAAATLAAPKAKRQRRQK